MVAYETFPYVEGKHGTESDRHVELKGLAVYWLLQRGFELDGIVEEYPILRPKKQEQRGSTLYVDIYAEQDGVEVYIECVCYLQNENSVSMGGKRKAREGEVVYVFADDGIYRLTCEEIEYDDWEIPKKILELDRVSNLPMLDLSVFSQ